MTECFRGSQATEKQQVGGKRRGTSEWKKKVFGKKELENTSFCFRPTMQRIQNEREGGREKICFDGSH